MRLPPLIIALSILLAACAGETVVEYRGTVTAADRAGHSFDPEPADSAPVAGASVTLRVCTGPCSGRATALTVESDASGAWGPIDLVFGGGFDDHEIRIEVLAGGYAPYTYSTIYERTSDPTAGEQFLNIRLGP